MASNNDKFGGWKLVIDSVTTPLGFFTLVALILDGVLLAMSAFTEQIPVWAPVGLLGVLIIGVFVIIWAKPSVLYHPRTVTVNLKFGIPAIDVDLDVEKCVLEIRGREGQMKRQRTPHLTFGHGGWSVQLPEDVEPYDSVRLELSESNGRKWRVHPFAPHEITKQALQINQTNQDVER